MEIKSSLNDSRNLLSNWRDFDEFPCKWTGVSCYHNEKRVRSMYVISPISFLVHLFILYFCSNLFLCFILWGFSETFHTCNLVA